MCRLAAWVKSPELIPPLEITLADVFDYIVDENGHRRGAALFLYESEDWTVFEDLSGYYWTLDASTWQSFAQMDDFIFAGYNDSIPYGALVVIENGVVIRDFLFDAHNPDENINRSELVNAQNPDENINRGELVNYPMEPIETWVDVASFVDSDEFFFSDTGTLWLHSTTA